MGCVEKFIENGKVVLRDCYSGQQQTPAPNYGPGTELKKLLEKIGIKASANCSCNARAKLMDTNEFNEPGWCEKNIDTIIGWLKEEAHKRGLPFVNIAGKILIKKAISNAKKNKENIN